MAKKVRTAIFTALSVIILTLCLAVSAFASSSIFDSISYKANSDDDNTIIHTQAGLDGSMYLFLPSSADFSNFTLSFDESIADITINYKGSTQVMENGVAADLSGLLTGGNEFPVTLTYTSEDNVVTENLTIMKSGNLRAMFLVSDDPISFGRKWVDLNKENEATGRVSLMGTDGEVDYSNKLTSLKGRGNSTFTDFAKKPYQIKLNKKADLINGNSDEASKKWVLLANAQETTLIRNNVTFSIASAMNMEYTPNFESIDLYYDGEYRGNYSLTEKTEVGSSRIDIENTDDLVEDANKDNAAYDAPVSITVTNASSGNTKTSTQAKSSYKYITGLNEPEITEGNSHNAYLLELELTTRYDAELSGFVTSRGKCVVAKTPEMLTKGTGLYISNFWQDFEDAVYSENGYNTKTGKYYYEYCDLDSLVNVYLINELSKNVDTFSTSSYFYLPENEDIMHAGPIWDYDRGYGIGWHNRDVDENPENFFATEKYLSEALIKIEGFRDAVKAKLNSENGEFYNAAQSVLGDNGAIAKLSARNEFSQAMNFKIWNINEPTTIVVKNGAKNTYDNSVDFLDYYISERITWLSQQTSEWNGDDYTITLDPEPISVKINSFFNRIISFFKSIFTWLQNLFTIKLT